MTKKIRITGTGCALADYVYNNINFSSPEFLKYSSKIDGDGGLSPGKLVFTEELEKFAGKSYPEILDEITKTKNPGTFNIGGPSIVSLIHVAQMLEEDSFEIDFYGISGNDKTSDQIRRQLQKTPLNIENYLSKSKKPTPYTHVLSDPEYANGHGERTFINNIGAAWDLKPELLPESFFESDIVCFGGTALTPNLHDNLHNLLKRAKSKIALTIVNTVYDFRNEKQNPDKTWPLGNSAQSFPNIDLLLMDFEESKRISGFEELDNIINFYKQRVDAFVITQGSDSVVVHSSGKIFEKYTGTLPVSEEVTSNISQKIYNGDTTGCGDNFTGGTIVSIAKQLQNKTKNLNLQQAIVSGICSGGFACSYYGGTYIESKKGEKKQQIEKLISAYQKQFSK